jgi:hypothetical protein
LPSVRQAVAAEGEAIRAARFPGHYRLREGAPPEVNAAAIGDFLSIPHGSALRLATHSPLFAD